MPSLKKLRKNFASCVNAFGEHEGRVRFVEEIREELGLMVRDEDDNLVESVDENGMPRLAKNSHKPESFSIRDLAVAIGGEQFIERFNPDRDNEISHLLEAGPGIDPSTFINTNMFSASVSGLIEAKILKQFRKETFIGDALFETIPTNKNGEKMPGTSGFQSTAGDIERKPGQPHPRGTFGERWIETPELTEKALACEVTQEAVFYDLTIEVLAQAGAVGDALGYGREKLMCDLFVGGTIAYNYGGTAYATYQASTPWINTHTNVFQDWSDIDNALELFLGMTDPETSREIEVEPDTVVYYKGNHGKWHQHLHGHEQRTTTNTNTQTLSTVPPRTTGWTEVQFGQTWVNRIVSSLSESAADAKEYWFIGTPKETFKWMEAWPLRVLQASPTEYAMVDRGLVAAYFANYRGVGAVIEPRYTVRNIQ